MTRNPGTHEDTPSEASPQGGGSRSSAQATEREGGARRPHEFEQSYFERYGGRAGAYGSRTMAGKWASLCRFTAQHEDAPRTALDYGCADGQFLAYARGFFPKTEWRGADVSQYAIEQARARLPGVELLRIEGPLPLSDASIDLATSLDVLEHIPELDRAIDDIARLVRSGGLLVAVVPVYDGPLGLVVRILDRDPTHLHKTSRQWWLSHPLLGRHFTLEGWHGAWRYHLGRYWHARSKLGRGSAPAIVMAWRRK